MNILITGGAGFIGSHLAEYLIRRGDVVYIIDDLSTGSIKNVDHLSQHPRFHCVIETILNRQETAKLVDRCDVVFHLAASVGVKLVVDKPLNSLKNNIAGTEIILELSERKNKRVLVTSSSEVYGKNDNLPFSEDDDRVYGSVFSSRWGYAFSKAIDEFLTLAYHKERGLPAMVVRLFNTVGTRQTGSYGMVIPRFVQQALNNQPLTVFGDGQQRRCFTDVSDVVTALVGLIECDHAIGDVFNIGSNNEIAIVDLARQIIRSVNSNSEITYVSYEDAYEKDFEDMKRRIPNIEKINTTIGYSPRISLDEIIRSVIQYHRDSR